VRGRRDGGEPHCGRPGIGEIGYRGLRWRLAHMRVAGKIRGRGLLTADDAEGRWFLDNDSRHRTEPHQPLQSEGLLVRHVCEGASTDRGCLTPVSLTCFGTRAAPVRCPSHCMRLADERRTTGASSVGGTPSMASSGTATHRIAATAATVVPERDGPALAMLHGFVAVDVVDGTGW